MPIPVIHSAIRAFLRADATVTAVVPSAQIYAGSMPVAEAGAQPRKSVTIQLAGGRADYGRNTLGRVRIDVKCYGSTELEAIVVSNAVHESLKLLTRRRVTSGSPVITPTLVHSVSLEGGPLGLTDEDGKWPFVLRTYEVLYAEQAA